MMGGGHRGPGTGGGGHADDAAYYRCFEVGEARVARISHRNGEVGGHAVRGVSLAGAAPVKTK